ncbi:MAG: hypothetical protein R3274_02995 [Desulfobacterales bacterium]|nr:hypothetical protein [Desulfobacterales bacterium]
MKSVFHKCWVSLFSVLMAGLLFSSCQTTGGGIIINGGNGPEGESSPVVKKGPPDHAPAHGYRAKHLYRYYPSCSVYYDCGRRIYFYINGDHWQVGASLPDRLRIRLGDSVNIELHTDKPYIHYAEHQKKYPPGQLKKKHKMKPKWG